MKIYYKFEWNGRTRRLETIRKDSLERLNLPRKIQNKVSTEIKILEKKIRSEESFRCKCALIFLIITLLLYGGAVCINILGDWGFDGNNPHNNLLGMIFLGLIPFLSFVGFAWVFVLRKKPVFRLQKYWAGKEDKVRNELAKERLDISVQFFEGRLKLFSK